VVGGYLERLHYYCEEIDFCLKALRLVSRCCHPLQPDSGRARFAQNRLNITSATKRLSGYYISHFRFQFFVPQTAYGSLAIESATIPSSGQTTVGMARGAFLCNHLAEVASTVEIADLLSLDDLFTREDVKKIVGTVKTMLA